MAAKLSIRQNTYSKVQVRRTLLSLRRLLQIADTFEVDASLLQQ
jgi:hypothetical protein